MNAAFLSQARMNQCWESGVLGRAGQAGGRGWARDLRLLSLAQTLKDYGGWVLVGWETFPRQAL